MSFFIYYISVIFFFFQAEDGIRDIGVTGVQTCALPILQQQNRDIEIKNREIELARRSLEEKAEQLAVSSRYKSEFLANMSHELRTPLNSLLILAKLLADNPQGNLDEKQVDFARTIFNAGDRKSVV